MIKNDRSCTQTLRWLPAKKQAGKSLLFLYQEKNKARASDLPVCASCHLGQPGLLTHLADSANFQGFFFSLSRHRAETATALVSKVSLPNSFSVLMCLI